MTRKLLVFLVVVLGSYPLLAQRTVSGTVTDATDGSPLPGVNVVEKGTSNGTSTDFDGNYTIEVASDASVLTFSSLGYSAKDVSVAGQSTINTSLEEDAEQLGEVVVTALGISKDQRKIGYAVTEVAGASLTQAREVNVANSLAGRVAGVQISSTSSGPGGTSQINLRGISSITGAGSPLIVIDGVPMDNTQRGSASQWGGSDGGDGISNINPDDIENMTVLKGQSASALYGSRASNGVIIITSKKGKKGGDWDISYNSNFVAEQAVDLTDFQEQYGQGRNGLKPGSATEARTTARFAWGAQLDGSDVPRYDGGTAQYSLTDNRYIDYYRTGSQFTNSVSVSRGLGNGSFRASGAFLDANAIVPNNDYQRYNFNVNATQDITDRLNVSANITYVNEIRDNIPNLSDGPRNPNNFLFLAPNIDHNIYDPGFDPVTGEEIVFSDDIFVTNPYFLANQGVHERNRKRLISFLSAKYNFTDRIYAMVRTGNDVANETFLDVEPWGLAYTRNRRGNLVGQGQSERSEFNLEGLLSGSFSLSQDLELDALVGANLRKNQFETVSQGGTEFVLPYLYTIFNTVDIRRNNNSYDFNKREVQSAYYSLDFSYKRFLTLTTTGRYDTYSSLPEGNRSLFVPSITGAFTFTEFANWDALSYGKFRASYAQTSGEALDPYIDRLYFNSGNTFNGIPTGSSPLRLPNQLQPFTTDEIEVGLDLKFFNNRLGLDIAYFRKETKDEIIQTDFSRASGFRNGDLATGSIRNQGLELLLTATPVQTENFAWNSSFNLTSLENEVLKTDNDGNNILRGQNRATLGNARTAFIEGEAGPQILAFDYARNADGTIQHDADGLPVRGEFTSFGSVVPTLYGGWNNEFNYKGFNLSFLIDYSFGNKVLSATEFYSTFRGLHQQTLNGREGGVTNNGVTVPAEQYYQELAQRITGTSVVDGDFIKLRQIILGYSFPSKIFEGNKVLKGINVSFVARNLAILHRKADNIDPENGFGSNVGFLGIEGTSLPFTRTFGLNANFKLK
ncbi:MAG: SusC/RagA family TonB-linked outer membrane protein [Bacteroidota bacterium]